jgi:hypothetical protein
MRLITRGLGGGQSSGLILQGMTFEVIRIIRAGRTLAKDVYDNLLEEFTIAAKLLQINGKDILSPIFNKRKYTVDESIEHKVVVDNLQFKKNKKEEKTSVFAKIKKVNRGSDGKY